ncbi:MAG: response regulator [Pseudorhodoplanes sp.]|nr:response regulator [Pseudorhodoplanes sp.]
MSDNVVHIIDDDEAVRDSLKFLLETAGITARSYESASAFLEASPRDSAGCIITDVRMPGLTGIDLLKRLKELGNDTPVIVITGHGDVPLAVEAMKAGAADFIEKPFSDDVILNVIHTSLKKSRGASEDHSRAAIAKRADALSARERQVLDGLLSGLPNKSIAIDLGISARTVEVYRANVMTKMGAKSFSELVRMAVIAGLGSDKTPPA